MSKKNRTQNNIQIPNFVGVSNINRLRALHQDKDIKITQNVKALQNIDVLDSNISLSAMQNKEMVSSDLRYEQQIYDRLMMGTNLFDNSVRRSNGYYDKSEEVRAAKLIDIAKDDIIADVVNKLAEEIIQYDENNEFCYIKLNAKKLSKLNLKDKVIKEVEREINISFNKVMRFLNFNRGRAIQYLEQYLIEGKQAFEIVYNDITKPTEIVDLIEVNPFKVKPYYYNGKKYWIHKREGIAKNDTIILLENQVNLTTWNEVSINGRMSYVEGLLRRYNMLKSIENSRILAGITAGIFRTITKIPTKNKSRIEAANTLATEASRLAENISLDADSGIITVNGNANFSSMRQAFQADGDSGSPDIQAVDNSGIQLDDAGLETFTKRFNKASRMPYSRFDDSGSTWNLDATSQLREEINFGNFVDRIRMIWGNLILKPVIIDFLLRNRKYVNEEAIVDAIYVDFVTNNLFKEQLKFEVNRSRMEYMTTLRDFAKITDPDGREIGMLSTTLLLQEFMGFDDEYMAKHRIQIDKDIKQAGEDLKQFAKYLPQEDFGGGEEGGFGAAQDTDTEEDVEEKQEKSTKKEEIDSEETDAEEDVKGEKTTKK